MSVVLIKDHNECIYDVKKVDPIVYEKPPRYISKYNSAIKERAVKHWQNKTHSTMGLAEEILPDPRHFLKKHTGQVACPKAQPEKKPLQKPSNIPNVPTVEECKKAYKRPIPNQNFVAKNIKTVKNMKPKEPIPKVVIDSTGTTKPLSHGLEPVFIKSREYAKTPEYLKKFQKVREKREQIEKDVVKLEPKKCHYVTKDERNELLNGLKENWNELQKQYQLLPILTDTIPKRNRKLKLEKELAQIEKDISLLEKHPYIYVYDEDNSIEN